MGKQWVKKSRYCFFTPNRFADVTAEGQYITSIASNGARFNAMLGALLGTRLALCLQALTAMKVTTQLHFKANDDMNLGKKYIHLKTQYGTYILKSICILDNMDCGLDLQHGIDGWIFQEEFHLLFVYDFLCSFRQNE